MSVSLNTLSKFPHHLTNIAKYFEKPFIKADPDNVKYLKKTRGSLLPWFIFGIRMYD